MTAVLGLDLSLTATGWAVWRPDGTYDVGRFGAPSGPPLGARLESYLSEFLAVLDKGADLVVVEDLPRTVRYGGVEGGHVHAVTRLELWRRGLPVLLLPPASLKKFATGKGDAGKDLMLVEAVRRLGYEGSDHNEADALWLAVAGICHDGRPCGLGKVPKAQLAALSKARTEAP